MLYSFAGIIKTYVDDFSFVGTSTTELPFSVVSIDNSFVGTTTTELPFSVAA